MGTNVQQADTGGWRAIDGASGAVAAVVRALVWTVARGATNTVTVGTLPANAQIVAINIQSPVASNAGTTATVSVGLSGGSATYFSTAQSVKSVANASMAATAGWAIAGTPQDVTCTYTETGTASTTGTAYVSVLYAVL